jgi:hypothetical protein
MPEVSTRNGIGCLNPEVYANIDANVVQFGAYQFNDTSVEPASFPLLNMFLNAIDPVANIEDMFVTFDVDQLLIF